MIAAITGGCQCGAVRYQLRAPPKSTFCHCRMCQKATGGVFAALSMVKKADLAWTKGEPSYITPAPTWPGAAFVPPAVRRSPSNTLPRTGWR